MFNSVTPRPVYELLNPEQDLVHAIPRYQRAYAWGKNQWEKLFEDLQDNDPGYFLGSIICINQTKDTADVLRLELVDGQQRLITLSLLLAALYNRLKRLDLDEDRSLDRANLKYRLVSRKRREPRLILQNQNNNNEDYRHMLAEAGVCDPLPGPKPRHAGNRNIFKGYSYFLKRLEALEASGENGTLFDFLEKIYAAVLVKMEVPSYAQAHTLFESLNNRGIPLTALDLIKNKLLASMKEERDADAAFDRWRDLMKGLGEEPAVQERFFRQHYNAFRAELREVGGESYATGAKLMRIYERLIQADAAGCLNRLCEAGRLYGRLLNPADDDPLAGPLLRLKRIQGTQSYQLLLYLLARQAELGLEDAQLARLIDRLTAFFVRRNLTDIPANRDLDQIFWEMIKSVGSLKGEALVAELARQLTEKSAPDEMFKEKLNGPMYVENAGVTRFILCALEEEKGRDKEGRSLWESEWSIEHVFPKGDRIPQCWVDMMAGGDREKAQDLLQSHAHKLGNLTLSGYNRDMSNRSFEDKRDLQKAGRFVGYKNGLALNEDLKDAETWNAERIDARTEKLVARTLALFPR